MTDDDTHEPPKADPMAAARAAKARKAAEKAEQELRAAEVSAASKADGQPTISTLKGRAEAPFEGDMVRMKVTPWGHGQISTGGEFGFERFARGAEFEAAEMNARALYNKRWAEPIEQRFVDRWTQANEADAAAAARRGARERQVLQHGVGPNETWSTALNG